MSQKLVANRPVVAKRGGYGKADPNVDYLGACVYCKNGVFSNQDSCRAVSPMIGLAHQGCLPEVDVRAEILAEQFPAVVLLERERPGFGGTQPPSAYVGRHRADELAAS